MQDRELAARNANIDRHALHVQTFARHAAALFVKQSVGFRRAIAGYYLEGRRSFEPGVKIIQKIEQPRINRMNISCAKIPQYSIDLSESFGLVRTITPIIQGQALGCVNVLE